MAVSVRKLRPMTNGARFTVVVKEEDLYTGRPHPGLVKAKPKKTSGRNNQGRMTVERRGGGHKRLLRKIDFKRDKDGIPARVERLEYDPNRTAHIALVVYKDGERRYIIAPRGVKAGTNLMSGPEAAIEVGNTLPMSKIPDGTVIHCIEMKPGKGAQMIRSAGGSAVLMAKDEDGRYVQIKLRSGERRKILATCRATIGEVGFAEHGLKTLGKAGVSRHLGRRPRVRGVAKNPVDHPHGGGEGRTSGGRHPVTKKGTPTKGYKTRRKKKDSGKYIVRDRRQK